MTRLENHICSLVQAFLGYVQDAAPVSLFCEVIFNVTGFFVGDFGAKSDVAVTRRELSFGIESHIYGEDRCSKRNEFINICGSDAAFGCQFSTYAVPKIAGEIRRYLRDDGTIKVSRGLKERGMAIRAARERLAASLGREPTLSQLSEATGLEPEEIAAAEEAGLPVASLQMETGDGLTLESVLGTDGMEEGIVERESLRGAIDALPDRERQVILLRYYRGMTQERAARVLGVSQVQVSRIERRAVERLRHKLEE